MEERKDNGHEPQDLNPDFVKGQLRRGGALVSVRVDMAGRVWAGKNLVPYQDITQSHMPPTEIIKRALQSLIATIDLERKKS